MKRALFLLTLCLAATPGLSAQDAARTDYFRAVAAFFNLPSNEVAILSDWEMPPDEIPVVLFVARRAGVSPEALVALRTSGQNWGALTARYRVSATALHVPVPEDVPTGALAGAYELFRSMPVADWGGIRLSDAHIIGLVNVRVIAQALGLPAEGVLGRTREGLSYVALHAELSR
jgi:hypothetical protein